MGERDIKKEIVFPKQDLLLQTSFLHFERSKTHKKTHETHDPHHQWTFWNFVMFSDPRRVTSPGPQPVTVPEPRTDPSHPQGGPPWWCLNNCDSSDITEVYGTVQKMHLPSGLAMNTHTKKLFTARRRIGHEGNLRDDLRERLLNIFITETFPPKRILFYI